MSDDKPRIMPTDNPIKHLAITALALGLIFLGYYNTFVYEQIRTAARFVIVGYTVLLVIYHMAWFFSKKTLHKSEQSAKYLAHITETYLRGRHAAKWTDHLTYCSIVSAFAGTGQYFYAMMWTWAWYEDFKHRSHAQEIINLMDWRTYTATMDAFGFDENGKKSKDQAEG